MKLDVSAAPELALLTVPGAAITAGTPTPGAGPPGGPPPGGGSVGAGSPSGGSASSGSPRGGSAGGGLSGSGSAAGGAPGAGITAAATGTASPAGPVTVGYLAACLRFLVSDPRRWWDLVRFDPQRPLRIPVTAPAPGCETWLLVLPPGYHGEAPGQPSLGDVTCLVAGAVTEQVPGAVTGQAAGVVTGQAVGALTGQAGGAGGWQDRPLAPGRTLVRGGRGPSWLVNSGAGYAVTLHARPLPG